MTKNYSGMTNQTQDNDRLTAIMRLENKKDRKRLIKLEIAKATDRTVRHALQDLLTDIEKEEKRQKIKITLIIVAVMVGVALLFFYLIGSSNNNQDTAQQAPAESELSQEMEITQTTTTEEQKVDATQLEEAQVKDWVAAVMVKKYSVSEAPNLPNYTYHVKLGGDSLVYIEVTTDHQDESVGAFRINGQGELEESGRFREDIEPNEWLVLSTEYPDVSQVKYVDKIISDRNISKPITAEELASLYSEWQRSNYPIMSASTFRNEFLDEAEEGEYAIVYSEKDSNTLQVVENRVGVMSRFFITYNLTEKKAYLCENNASQNKSYMKEFTEFIKANSN